MSKLDPLKVNQESVRKIVDMLENLPESAAKHNAAREAEHRMDFEKNNPSYIFERGENGTYKNKYVEAEWIGWRNCLRSRKGLRFMGMEIQLPIEQPKRMIAIDELSVVFGCYITQLLETWPKDHARMNSVFLNIEKMCIRAYSVMEEDEFHYFSSRLIDKDFIAKKRF